MAEKRKTTVKGKSKKTTKKVAVPKNTVKKKAVAKAVVAPHDLRAPLPSSFHLVGQVWRIFRAHWRVLTGIVVVYLILNILFASGLSSLSSAVDNIRQNFDASGSSAQALPKALSGFITLVGSAGASGSASASLLQSGLFVIESLVIIWALRQLLAGKLISVKEAYYHSTYPLIPFLLVLLVILAELLPISIGAVAVNAVLTTAVANLSVATWLSGLFFVILAGWSFYMLSSTIFAAYIVTLPEVQPREAMRSARNLVKYRRWAVIPKIIFLPVFIFAVMGLAIIPLIIFAPGLVAPVFYALGMLAILFVHSYLYSLYRGLLA